MTKRFTKKQIESIAKDIRNFLDEHYLNGDCRIYFNGKCWEHGTEDGDRTWDEKVGDFVDKPFRSGWKTIEDIDPKDYFQYVGDILSMSFEGSLYEVLNGWGNYNLALQDEFWELLGKYGLHYELGNAWNLSLFEV